MRARLVPGGEDKVKAVSGKKKNPPKDTFKDRGMELQNVNERDEGTFQIEVGPFFPGPFCFECRPGVAVGGKRSHLR